MEISQRLTDFGFYNTRIKLERVNCGLKVLLWEAGRPAGRVLEELELKPTQTQTEVGLGLGFGLSLAKTIYVNHSSS